VIRESTRSNPALRCSFCHGSAADAITCPGCGTLIHLGCREEAGGWCPTLGCASAIRRPVANPARPRVRNAVMLLGGAVLFCVSASMLRDFDTLLGFEGLLFVFCVLGAVGSVGLALTMIVAPSLRQIGAEWAKRPDPARDIVIGLAVLFVIMVGYLGICAGQVDTMGSSDEEGSTITTGPHNLDRIR
jgi:hypothetical protein